MCMYVCMYVCVCIHILSLNYLCTCAQVIGDHVCNTSVTSHKVDTCAQPNVRSQSASSMNGHGTAASVEAYVAMVEDVLIAVWRSSPTMANVFNNNAV